MLPPEPLFMASEELKLKVISNCPLKSALSQRNFPHEKFIKVFELCRQGCILFSAHCSTTTHLALAVKIGNISKGHSKLNLFHGLVF